MTKSIVTLALFATVASAALPAMAQSGGASATSPLAVRLGGYFPTQSAAQADGNHTMFSAGVDYNLVKRTDESDNTPGLYLDYANGSKNGGNVNVYGGGISMRSATKSIRKSQISPYFGAGIGYYNVKVKDSGTKLSETKRGFGGKLFAGLGFGGPLFVEVTYQIVPKANGVDPNGVGAQVGLRF